MRAKLVLLLALALLSAACEAVTPWGRYECLYEPSQGVRCEPILKAVLP